MKRGQRFRSFWGPHSWVQRGAAGGPLACRFSQRSPAVRATMKGCEGRPGLCPPARGGHLPGKEGFSSTRLDGTLRGPQAEAAPWPLVSEWGPEDQGVGRAGQEKQPATQPALSAAPLGVLASGTGIQDLSPLLWQRCQGLPTAEVKRLGGATARCLASALHLDCLSGPPRQPPAPQL